VYTLSIYDWYKVIISTDNSHDMTMILLLGSFIKM
jgi:hypothetical protein